MAQTFQADGKQFEDEHENADYSLARQGPVKAGQSRSRLVKVGQGKMVMKTIETCPPPWGRDFSVASQDFRG